MKDPSLATLFRGQSLTLTVYGFKSIYEPCVINVRPLTLLAGANSSGKSSVMQPLLLIKQTLDSPYDPGALLLSGPNANFTKIDQMLSKGPKGLDNRMVIALDVRDTTRPKSDRPWEDVGLCLEFRRSADGPLEVAKMTTTVGDDQPVTLTPEMTASEIRASLTAIQKKREEIFKGQGSSGRRLKLSWQVFRDRCFLYTDYAPEGNEWRKYSSRPFQALELEQLSGLVQNMIHVPGLRGNPARNYPSTAVDSSFPGTFENYVASVIAQWQTVDDPRLKTLSSHLKALGLGWKISARPVDDSNVELMVARLRKGKQGGAKDMVSIADVGFGVSQTLPVLVSLLVASPGQLVYIEQPEIHLHPNAQHGLAAILIEAAMRGVHCVVETHSSILLLGIQTLAANNSRIRDLIGLNWFSQDEDGHTRIATGALDNAGSYGDWPEDFGEVALKAEAAFLDAALMDDR